MTQPARLKYCTARSCFSAAARVANVPRFLRLLLFGSFFDEYNRYCPFFNLRIMPLAQHSGDQETSESAVKQCENSCHPQRLGPPLILTFREGANEPLADSLLNHAQVVAGREQ